MAKHEMLEICSTFLYQIFYPFLFLFSQFFNYFYMDMGVKPPAHSLTHTPAVPKKKGKKRVKSIVHHGTSKSNAYLLLLLALHMRCLLVAMLVRRFVIAAHDRQIAPLSRPCQVTYL